MESLVKTKSLKKTTTIPLQIIVVDGGLIVLPIQEIVAMIILGVVTTAGIVAVAAEIDLYSEKGTIQDLVISYIFIIFTHTSSTFYLNTTSK